MQYSEYRLDQELQDILEETFDTCTTNREEVYWLITILRCFMRIQNKRSEFTADNINLNKWQAEIAPIVENFMEKWKL